MQINIACRSSSFKDRPSCSLTHEKSSTSKLCVDDRIALLEGDNKVNATARIALDGTARKVATVASIGSGRSWHENNQFSCVYLPLCCCCRHGGGTDGSLSLSTSLERESV